MKIKVFNSKSHLRKDFSCGEELLDNYLKKQVSQDVKRNLTTCSVLVDSNNVVKGYYTLSSSAVRIDTLPANLSKKLPPSYTELPYALLGRLAIDNTVQGQGYGVILLIDALLKCVTISEQIGLLGVVVDPINKNAIKFYENFGFVLLPTSQKMVISMETIKKLKRQ